MNDLSVTNWRSNSDSSILKIIGSFVKHHRVTQNIKQDELAKNADISRSTLSLLEKGKVVNIMSLIKVLRVLDLLHILHVFEVQTQVSPLEIAKQEEKKRKRVRKDKNENYKSEW